MGSRDRQLFGVYYPSKIYPSISHGILICPPIGHEYMRTHKILQQLAVQFSSVGFDVLKFDYYGVGDSAGNCEQGDVEIWKDDIYKAYQELKDISGVRSISIVGMRLGAALAAATISAGLSVKNLLMWDPIINGVAYIRELRELTSKVLNGSFEKEQDGTEILGGFPFSANNLLNISAIDLLTLTAIPKDSILLYVSEHCETYVQLYNNIYEQEIPLKPGGMLSASTASSVSEKRMQEVEGQLIESQWVNRAEFDQALIAPNSITEIISMFKSER
jgi:uncharacterized protein